jgi:hypothetical protein
MDQKTKLILALQQTENIFELLREGQYAGFFASHLLPIKFEIERQLSCLTVQSNYTKITE